MDLLFPNIAYASLDSFLTNVNNIIVNPLINLLFVLALAYFLYGIFEFMSNQENEEKKTAGKKHMIYGIIGLTVMMGVWTILNIILRTAAIPQSEINPEQGTVNLRDYNPSIIP